MRCMRICDDIRLAKSILQYFRLAGSWWTTLNSRLAAMVPQLSHHQDKPVELVEWTCTKGFYQVCRAAFKLKLF